MAKVKVPTEKLTYEEFLAWCDEDTWAEKEPGGVWRNSREGKTILLVTHGLGTVENWCHQALWLEGGRVRALGDPGTCRYVMKRGKRREK